MKAVKNVDIRFLRRANWMRSCRINFRSFAREYLSVMQKCYLNERTYSRISRMKVYTWLWGEGRGKDFLVLLRDRRKRRALTDREIRLNWCAALRYGDRHLKNDRVSRSVLLQFFLLINVRPLYSYGCASLFLLINTPIDLNYYNGFSLINVQ